jgi:virginiamycin A acetyltransferase
MRHGKIPGVNIQTLFKKYVRKFSSKLSPPVQPKKVRRSIDNQKLSETQITSGFGTYGVNHITLHKWDLNNKLIIGKYSAIADEVHIFLGGNHNTKTTSSYPFQVLNSIGESGFPEINPTSKGDVIIGNDVWIGSHVSIMSGVTIGDGAVIAAYSHVVKDVPPYTIFGGNPAEFINKRFNDEIIECLLKIKWWEWELDKIKENFEILTTIPDIDGLSKLLIL